VAQIPIRSLTIYKQGIGYFRRRGVIDDSTVSLVVPRDSLNDVLKSLDIIVHAGGPLQSVDYETPADKAQQLADLPIKLADRAALADLLVSLRGSAVSVQRGDSEPIEGRLIGVEASLPNLEQPSALVLQHDAELHVIPLPEVRTLALRDERAAQDVRFFLDVSRTEQARTTLTVRLAPGSHDLELNYNAPSPTWRVSYRLAGDGSGRARLVGWGLFDNTLDEDLENVELTLISGRPVSFTYELAETRVPTRPQVADDPTALEQAAGDRRTAEAISTLAHELRSPLTSIRGYADLLGHDVAGALSDDQRSFVNVIRDNAGRVLEQLTSLFELVRIRDRDTPALPGYLYRSGPLGDLKVSGSYFLPVQMGNAEQSSLTYRAPTPISARRGQAALVPIIDTEVVYEELCVYNGAKMSNHPLLVWRLRNTSGVALEQGPATLTAAGSYLGEGLVRFTGVDDDLQVPYALEFGVLVSEEREYPPRVLQRVVFNADERRAEVSWYHSTHMRYTLASNVRRDVAVLVEHRDPPRGAYFEMPTPADAREGHTRWSVMVPAGGRAELVVREREVRISYENVTTWRAEYVTELREAGGLHDADYERLQRLLAIAQEREDAEARQAGLEAELAQILDLQEQLRKNLGALGTSDREVALRNRLLDDLEASEERRHAIAAGRHELEQQSQEREAHQQAVIDELFRTA
jgi:His Kinase A (phospho-acceptor) domain